MAKRIERSKPAYVQIAEYYERLIRNGTLSQGERLPAVRQLADEWDVTPVTANRGVKYLEAAQLIETTRAGTVVRRQRTAPSPRDRIRLELRSERLPSESVTVTEAGLVTRQYVARLLGLEDNEEVVRREQITHRGSSPVMLSVHWLPKKFAELAPELATREVLSTVTVVQRATGRSVERGSDATEGRAADDREARALGISAGSPILAGVWSWSDADGVIEYGEYVCPEGHVMTYEYDVLAEEPQP